MNSMPEAIAGYTGIKSRFVAAGIRDAGPAIVRTVERENEHDASAQGNGTTPEQAFGCGSGDLALHTAD
jgi:hypothetical protein